MTMATVKAVRLAEQVQQTTPTAQTVTSDQALLAEVVRLRAENERLHVAQAAKITLSLKIGEKGGLSVYGLGRFPLTLYAGQWERLLNPVTVKGILDYIKANRGSLATK